MTCQNWIPIDYCARREALSERALARLSELSRDCLCRIKADKTNVELSSLVRLSSFLSRNLLVLSIPTDTDSECATIAVALKVQRDGFESWKVHFMDFVDAFRRSADPRLVLLPLPRNFDLRLTALLASIVMYLCNELSLPAPDWAKRSYCLNTPWFVSEVESLKALALLESPIWFRANNIFVHSDFLARI